MSKNFKASKIKFHEDTLLMVVDQTTSTSYIAFHYIFNAIGFSEAQTAAYLRKIKKNPLLEPYLITFNPTEHNLPLNKELLCISLKKLQLALSMVSLTPKFKRERPEAEKKLLLYQHECEDVIMASGAPECPLMPSEQHILEMNPSKIYKAENDVLEAIKLLTQSINIAFCSIDERLSNIEDKLMQTETINNASNAASEKIITSDWTGKIFRKYDLITEALGITYKMLYQQIIKVIQKKYKNININQVICNYCDKHNVKTCYPLEAIEDNELARKAFENALDNIIFNCKLDKPKKNYNK